MTNFTNSYTDALDDTAHDTGHQRQRLNGGPRARTSTPGGHPRRSPPVARSTGPRPADDPVRLKNMASNPTVAPDTTTSVVTAPASATTATNNADDHREASVWVRPSSSFTAAHPHR
jgi:hypothetical protein